MHTDSEFTIVGAGVAGLTAGYALQSIGRTCTIFEQSKALKGIGAGFGLAANAMKAFELLHLRDDIEQIGHHLESYNILDDQGKVLFAPDTGSLSQNYQQRNFAIHRADLHQFLLSKVQSVHLAKRAVRFEQTLDSVTIYFEDGTSHRTRYLLIADGVKSALRQQLIPHSKPRYAGYTCWRATISNTELKLEKGSETWGKDGRFGLTPLVNNRIYWYACNNSKPQNQVYKNYTVADLYTHFEHYHNPIPQVLKQTNDRDLIWNDIIDIAPIKHFAYGNILLIGDAAHATTPNMGQGACQAIEDVAVLIDELTRTPYVDIAFKNFERRRLARTKYITDNSKRIGEIAQLDQSLLITGRNIIMRLLPQQLAQYPIDKLLSVDFMKIKK